MISNEKEINVNHLFSSVSLGFKSVITQNNTNFRSFLSPAGKRGTSKRGGNFQRITSENNVSGIENGRLMSLEKDACNVRAIINASRRSPSITSP